SKSPAIIQLIDHYAGEHRDSMREALDALMVLARAGDEGDVAAREMVRRFFTEEPEDAKRSYQDDAIKYANRIHEHLNALSPAEQLVEVYEKLIEPTLM